MNIFTVIGIITVATIAGTLAGLLVLGLIYLWRNNK